LDGQSNEAIQSVASVYNTSVMTVKDLNVTGNLTVSGNTSCTGTSTLGQWSIRNDKIGIKDRGDIHLAPDKWVRLLNYDEAIYNPNGFAGNQSYSQSSTHLGNTMKIGETSLGEINLKSLTFRKNNVAGYYSIRAYGYKIPIYYGINMLWTDKYSHTYAMNIVKNTEKSQKYIWTAY